MPTLLTFKTSDGRIRSKVETNPNSTSMDVTVKQLHLPNLAILMLRVACFFF